jgi:uncharacterized protein (DUF427 family)
VVKAFSKGVVLAQSDRTVIVEGNHSLPEGSVQKEYLRPSETNTVCPWKGTASDQHVEVDGERNAAAAWYYPALYAATAQIKGGIAFSKGVRVEP